MDYFEDDLELRRQVVHVIGDAMGEHNDGDIA